jgi:hypothetical protein
VLTWFTLEYCVKRQFVVKTFTKDRWIILCEINLVKKVTMVLGEHW